MYEFNALGTHWWCEDLSGNGIPDALRHAIDDEVARFVRHYSRFDESSLLSQLNRDGVLKNPPVEMVAMMRYAREMFERTQGVFNISVGGALNTLGYGVAENGAPVRQSFWDGVIVGDRAIVIPTGVSLDFGGFGKGWLIDALAKLCEAHGVKAYCINGGGDLFVNSPTPVEFALEHPLDPTQKIGSTKITRGALAASSTIKRSWSKNGEMKHHIIDPTTGDSALSSVVASFVRADSALIADTLATVAIIDPIQKTALEREFGAQVILITREQMSV